MDILKARYELRRMGARDVFKLALSWKISYCLVGGRPCRFLLQYKGSIFCVSEILAKGCQVGRLSQFEQLYDEREKVNPSTPRPESQGSPSTRARAEGLRVDPERQAVEWVNFSLPFPQKMERELLLPRREAVEFKVYYGDRLTSSIVFLGKIIERRRKERGDNLKGLLTKAIEQYSDHVKDPSKIFLMKQ